MSALLTPKKGRSEKSSGKPRTPAPVPPQPPVFQEEEGVPVSLPARLTKDLTGLIARYRRLALFQGAAVVALAAAVLLLFQVILDGLLHLSVLVRTIFLVVDTAIFVFLIYRGPYRTLRKSPTLERASLLAQKKWPSLKGSLVAAVQLTHLKRGVPQRSAQLVRELLVQVERETGELRFRDVLPAKLAGRFAAGAAVAWMVLGLLFAFHKPLGTLLLKRVALSTEGFPAETVLTVISKDLVVSVGDNVQLEARAQGVIPERGLLFIRHQDGSQEKLAVDSPPDRRGMFSLTMHNVQQPFHYRFQVNDAKTSDYEVKTRLTPLVRSLETTEAYPPYTGLAPQNLSPNQLSLLAGSTLKVHLAASTPLSRATVIFQGKSGQLAMQIPPADPKTGLADIPIPAADLTGFTIALVDQNGVASVHDPLYPIDIVTDDPPAARIVQPVDESLTVTLQTKLAIAFEVSDNYGLSRVRLHFEITPAATGDEDPKPVESTPIEIDLKQLTAKPGVTSTVTYPLAVGAQTPAWHEGDTIRYWVEATDNNNVTGPGVTLSSAQRLLVVTPEAKRDEIFQRLEDNANIMQDILKDQSELNDQTQDTTK